MRQARSWRAAALVCLAATSGCQSLPPDPRISASAIAAPASTAAGSQAPEPGAGDLASLVVLPGDLALLGDVEYHQFDGGPVGRADILPPPRDDTARFGREAGWKARYRRDDPSDEKGILVIGSRVDSFQAPGGAKSELELIADEAQARAASGAVRLLETEGVGDASIVLTYEQAAAGRSVVYYEYYWRSGRYSASVVLSGFEGELSIADAVLLARAVQARIAVAPG